MRIVLFWLWLSLLPLTAGADDLKAFPVRFVPLEFNKVEDDLRIETSCEVRCVGKESLKKPAISKVFNPGREGLKKGNGNLWATLGAGLQNWGRSVCFAEAKRSCGSWENIEDFAVLQLKSGKWLLDRSLSCVADHKPVLSPYDPTSGALHGPFVDSKLFEGIERPSRKKAALSAPLKPGAPCEKPISSQVCMGDCVSATASRQFLSSGEKIPSWPLSFCGDSLGESLKSQAFKATRSQVLMECETHYWDSYQASPDNAHCASVRADVDCSALLKAFGYEAPKAAAKEAVADETEAKH